MVGIGGGELLCLGFICTEKKWVTKTAVESCWRGWNWLSQCLSSPLIEQYFFSSLALIQFHLLLLLSADGDAAQAYSQLLLFMF